MEVCPSIVLNSDASENVAYNNPDFPAYIKKFTVSSWQNKKAGPSGEMVPLFIARSEHLIIVPTGVST